MTKLSRLTLMAATLGTLALPALAQGAAPASVARQHHTVKPVSHLHHIATTAVAPVVIAPASPVTPPASAMAPAVLGVPAKDKTAMSTSPAPIDPRPSVVTPVAPRTN